MQSILRRPENGPAGGVLALLLLAASTGPTWAQDLYVANLGSHSIARITPQGVVSTFASGFSSPYDVAFSSSGEMFVANFGSSSISRVSSTGVVSNFNITGAALNKPMGLAFATNGDLYVSNFAGGSSGTGSIVRITPQGVSSTFATGLTAPADLAFTANGELYASNFGGGGTLASIYRILPNGTFSNYLTTSFLTAPYGVATQGNDVYGASTDRGKIAKKSSPTGGATDFVRIGGTSSPMGMAFNATGELFVARDIADSTVEGVAKSPDAIYRVSRTGVVSNFALTGESLDTPAGMAFLFPSSGAAMPEPGSLALLGLGGMAGAGARILRRRHA